MPPVIVRLAAFSLAYILSCLLGMLFRTEPEKFAIVWPPNGLLLGLLIVWGRAERVRLVLVAVGCQMAVNLLKCNSLPVSLGFTAVNVAEPCLLAWGWHRLVVRRGLWGARRVFVLYALALGGCAVTALPGAAVVVFGLGAADFGASWLAFWLADAMGVILITPLVIAWAGGWRGLWAGVTARRAAEGVTAFAVLLTLAELIFAEPNPAGNYALAFPFPLFPLLLWAGLRFGVRGATLALAALSLSAVWHTGHGGGPFADPGVPTAYRLLMVQAFLSVIGLSVLTLAAVVAERTQAVRALQASEQRYRQVTDTIEEAFWVVNLAPHRVEYMSPAYQAIWGRTCASLYADPMSFVTGLHPDDRPRVLAWVTAVGTGVDELEFRVVRPDGAVRWVHTRRFPVAGGGRLVGVTRDVTDRKRAELAREEVIAELQQAVAEIKTLRGLIPICSWCRQIRDDDGFWQRLEVYLGKHTEATFTHSICPHCTQQQLAALVAERGGN